MKTIRIDGQDYDIHYGQNAICALEDELNVSIVDLLKRVQEGRQRLTDLRAIIWAGMLWRRRNITPEIVGSTIEAGKARIRDIAVECVEDLVESFNKYIVVEEERQEESEKNA
jgi:hypothetical protein